MKKKGEAEGYLCQIEELCRTRINRDGTQKNQLWLLLDKVAGLWAEEECDEVTYFPTNICHRPNFYLKKEWFSDIMEMKFEGLRIPVPNGYDSILTAMFGDYMTPSYDAGRAHEYPFYKRQEEYIRSHGIL